MLKPARWALQPSLVAPEWAWFWKDTPIAMAFNEGGTGSRPYPRTGWPYHKETVQDATPPGWVATPYGAAYETGTSDKIIKLAVAGDPRFDIGSEVTLLWFGSKTTNGKFMLCKGYSTTYDCALYSGGSSSDLIFFHHPNTSVQFSNLEISNGMDDYHRVAISASADEVIGFVDGEFESKAGVTLVNNSKQFVIGARQISGSESYDLESPGRHLMCAMINKALTRKQISQWARDPFGPFRMADDYAVWKPAEGGGGGFFARRYYDNLLGNAA